MRIRGLLKTKKVNKRRVTSLMTKVGVLLVKTVRKRVSLRSESTRKDSILDLLMISIDNLVSNMDIGRKLGSSDHKENAIQNQVGYQDSSQSSTGTGI